MSLHTLLFDQRLLGWFGRRLAGLPADRALPDAGPEEIRGFLEYHGIEELVHELATASSVAVDLSALRLPDTEVKRRVAVDMARWRELDAVLTAIRAQTGTEPIIFKGQALACNLYTRSWQRPRLDIDMLVESERLDALLHTFRALGYGSQTAIDGDLISHQVTFSRLAHGCGHNWDIHWKLSNRPALADVLTYPRLARSASRADGGGVTFLVPDRADDLLIACLHLVGHHSHQMRLIWLYDILLLTTTMTDAAKQRFMSSAKECGISRYCFRALSLAQQYMPNPVQQVFIDELEPELSHSGGETRLYVGQLIDDAGALTMRDKLRFARQHVFPSRKYMMSRFGIRHRWQLPFWYAFRIARAVPKLFKRR